MVRHPLAHVLTAFAVACTAPDTGDARDDDFFSNGKADGSYSEGSPEALGVLAVANTLTAAQLDDDVELDDRAVNAIVEHRDGADATASTPDDDRFDTLAELDAVPYVGPVAFAKLLQYALANGLVAGSEWLWENPNVDGTERSAVFAVAPNDVWAVGARGFVERWDGSSWKVLPTGTTNNLHGVWGTDPNNVWIAGAGGTVLHWTGASFTPLTIRQDFLVSDVSGTSGTDIWFVGQRLGGDSPNGVAGHTVHWDGIAFDAVDACGAASLTSVLAISQTDVWVGGELGNACHFDGTTWTGADVVQNGGSWVTDMWRSPTGTLWAVHDGQIWRRDGSTWSLSFDINTGSAEPSQTLIAIDGISANQIWATGSGGYVARFNGSTWTKTRVPGNGSYVGIAVTGSSSAWAVGAGARAKLAGTSWTETIEAVTRQRLARVSGTSATNLWSVGTGNDVIRRTASGWSKVAVPIDYIHTVYAAADNDVWIMGDYGSARWNGQSFTIYPDVGWARGVWGSSNDLWTVGSLGEIRHFDGATWTTTPAISSALSTVSGSSPTNIWAVGHRTVARYDGNAWSLVPLSDTDRQINWSSVLALAPDDVWIAGRNYAAGGGMLRQIRHWNGTTWTTVAPPTPTGAEISVAWAASPDDVWFVEHSVGLLRWNETSFVAEPLVGADAVIGFPGEGLWATGQSGMVRRRAH